MATTGTIHGFVLHNDDTPVAGKAVFAYPEIDGEQKVILDPANNAMRIDAVRVNTSRLGEFSLTVTASDDLTLDPHSVTWKVAMPGIRPVSGVYVPGGQVVEMASLTPADPAAPAYAAQVTRAEFDALAAEVGAAGDDPRFPSHPYPPPPGFDWTGVIFYYETDPLTGALVDAYEAPGA